MGKKRNQNKTQNVNVFKVSEGRAKKAKKNQANINFKKFKIKTREDVDKLNTNLNTIEANVRKSKPIQSERNKPIVAVSMSKKDVNIDETIADFSNL